MKIGFAKNKITPDLPVLLAGFAKERLAEQVLDDVFVKVIVYENNTHIQGIISYDLVGIDETLMSSLSKQMDKMQLDISDFIVAATHTHSAPGGGICSHEGILKGTQSIFMPFDQNWLRYLVEQTINALQKAIKDGKECNMYVAYDTISNIGRNRNETSFAGNDDLFVVYLEQVQGAKVVLSNFACHPTVLNATNEKISADFPGVLESKMLDEGYDFSLFLNGSCGDISTRFTRIGEQYEEVQRFGNLLANKIIDMRARAIQRQDICIQDNSFTVPLRLRKADDILEAHAMLEKYTKAVEKAKHEGIEGSALRLLQSQQEGAQSNVLYAKNAMTSTIYYISINMYKINEDIFVCIPGELFSQLSNEIQDEHTHFITYANGYHGYFADKEAYDKKYYEALSSPFERGQAEHMIDIIKQKINTLKTNEKSHEDEEK